MTSHPWAWRRRPFSWMRRWLVVAAKLPGWHVNLKNKGSRGGARGVPGGPLPLQILPGPPKIFRVMSCHYIEVLHRPLTAPLVANLAPPVAPPNENVWLRPWKEVNTKIHELKNRHEIHGGAGLRKKCTVYIFNLRLSRLCALEAYWGSPITGMANQSETMRHISYCVTAKSHITHMGTHEHHPISFLLTHIPCSARLTVHTVPRINMTNDRTLQCVYCIVMHVI